MAGFALLVLVATGVVLMRSDREVVTPPPTGPGASASAEGTRSVEAGELLDRLEDALADGSRRETLALAASAPQAREGLALVHDNVRRLDITDLSLRFVGENPQALSGQERRTFGADAWVGDVALDWRIDGFDSDAGSMEVSLTFADTDDGVAFGSATGDHGRPAPLWLLSRLAVRESARSLVAVSETGTAERFSRLADEAVRDVRAVLPRWRGRLVVEVPSSQEQLHRLLDADPGAYASIAAVTATVDGSLSPDAPVHILVNPEVFGKLGAQGSQIVMSHEATHVAVEAATASMPLWLLEGFADYVALARSDLPVSVTASQILAQVRRQGPPRSLPGPREFDPTNKQLGTSYESAWLACRLIAEEYGERRLVAFYDDVDAGATVAEAFAELGTTERAFTRQWRDHLRELAG